MNKQKISTFVSTRCLSFIQERLNTISYQHKNVILFGAGSHAEYLLKNFDFSMFNITTIVDSDLKKHGKHLLDIKISSPECIPDDHATAIIIMSYETQDNILKQLQKTVTNKELCPLYNKSNGQSMDCSLYFYQLEQSRINEEKKRKKLFDAHLTLCDYHFAQEYIGGKQQSAISAVPANVSDLKYIIPKNHVNICLVILDCVRAQNLSCYGYHRITTPFIDSLKKKSFFFNNAFSNSNWTLPSHSSMLTGKLPSEHGALGGRFSKLPYDQVRLPELLAKRGYQNIGCFSIRFMNKFFGTAKGFHFYEQGPVKELIINPAPVIIQTALEQIKPSKPFFLMLNFAEAHSPFKTLRHRFGNPLNDLEQPLTNNLKLQPYSEQEVANTISCYDDAIKYMDSQLAYLKSVLPENTLFIITSDHGEVFNEHKGYAFNADRAGLFDEVLHVPLIIHHPGQSRSQVVKELYPLKNLFDFVINFVDNNHRIDGKYRIKTEDFIIAESDAFIGNVEIYGREIFAYNKACVRTLTHKLILSGDGNNSLFELPNEKYNLYGHPDVLNVQEKLTFLLQQKSKLPLVRVT